jgi:tRNA modification GTPase
VIRDGTIVAISTPIGEGGIGIVRLSGPDAVGIVERVFQPSRATRLSEVRSHTLHYGHIVSEGAPVDEVLVTVMRAPRTYTREDIVEINCHGGILATRTVLDLVLSCGARLAEAGEFTRRAFLNGRLSLDQARAVAEVVRAQSRLGLEAAVDQLGGRFSDAITAVRDGIAALLAQIEVGIDYPDVDAPDAGLSTPIETLRGQVADLLAQAAQGRVVREGLTVAIVGRPNVGKSTLLNALLAEERAIVTDIPGTTRDTVEEIAAIEGIPTRLIDTAGLRRPGDAVEEEGVRRAERAIARCDLVLLLLDGSQTLTDEDRTLLSRDWDRPLFVVVNKIDLPRRLSGVSGPGAGLLEISAKERLGIEALSQAIADHVLAGRVPSRGGVLLLDAWEHDLLRRLKRALDGVAAAIEAGGSPDMVAEELRGAQGIAGELQGVDATEEVLDHLFRRFCVGK